MKLHERYKDKVEFLVVYIREAHAIDGPRPLKDGPEVETPKTLEERGEVAKTCSQELKLGEIPLLVDGMDDATEKAWSAWPDRLFLVDAEGRIAYRGGQGPRGFKPEELEKALEEATKRED